MKDRERERESVPKIWRYYIEFHICVHRYDSFCFGFAKAMKPSLLSIGICHIPVAESHFL
jgi:hypothetical protein